MRAIIPAAGLGERLRPLTLHKPKVLLPVAGKPIIGHIYDRLLALGIDEVTVIIGHLGDMVREYSQRNYPLKFHFVEQTEQRGLGHAVGLGLDDNPEPVLIILGDTILDLDYFSLIRRTTNVIGVMPVEDPRRFGVVLLENGRVMRLIEKPSEPISKQAIAGIYLIQNGRILRDAIDYIVTQDIRTKNEYQLTDALQVMLTWGEQFGITSIENCFDCGTPETLLATNRALLQRQRTEYNFPGCKITAPVYIASDAFVENSTIGPYVSLSNGARVRDSSIVDSIIDEAATITNSQLERALVAAHSVLEGKIDRPKLSDNANEKSI